MDHSFLSEYGHVKLRPLLESDIESLRFLRNKYRSNFIYNDEIDEEQQKAWFARYLNKQDDIMFSISCPTMSFAGAIGIYNIDYSVSCAEFGRIVVSEDAPKLTGTYAIDAVLQFARDVLGIQTVTCSVINSNRRAISVYERIGFSLISSSDNLSYYSINTREISCVTKRL